MQTLKQLLRYGDRLERTLFANADFARMFHVYPHVWADYVLPNRDPKHPRRIVEEFGEFAEHHYTAIVRCWTAFQAFTHIQETCTALADKPEAEAVLRLHAQQLTFFAAVGAVVEHLADCFKSAPLRLRRRAVAEPPVYSTRNRFIHEVLIPIEDAEGLVWFGDALLEDDNLHWRDAVGGSNEEVLAFHEREWREFVGFASAEWAQLYDALKKKLPRQKDPVAVVLRASSSPY